MENGLINFYLNLYNNFAYSKNLGGVYDKVLLSCGYEYKILTFKDVYNVDFLDNKFKQFLLFNDVYIIPVYFVDLHLGFICRSINDKRFFYIKFFDDFLFVFGCDRFYDSNDVVFFVEGVKDCLVLKMLGYNSIALLGNSINDYVLDFIKYGKFKSIFIGDNDRGGDILYKQCKELKLNFWKWKLGKDVGENIDNLFYVKDFVENILRCGV